LIPAAFFFWRAAASAPAHSPLNASAAPPRYVTKSIEDVREGDFVLARDEFGRDLGMKRVTEVYRRVSDHLRILTLRAADGTEQTLKTTNEHPFWAENRRVWIEARYLEVGDTVIGPRGELQTLADTAYEAHPDEVPVFNIQVDDYHSYFAAAHRAGSDPILVHNADYPTGTWGAGSFGSAEESLLHHFDKHGAEVGAETVEQYLRKAEGFAQNLRRATKSKVDGATASVTRYKKAGKYIDLDTFGNIISFGAQ
jgi:hypothetical protein